MLIKLFLSFNDKLMTINDFRRNDPFKAVAALGWAAH
jgi:hypothetical protein